MAEMRVLESDDQRSELRQRQPHRSLPLEHAALALVRSPAHSLAGYDERHPRAVCLRALQEAEQFGMGLCLRIAVQIETRIDGFAAARDTLLQPPTERREGGRLFLAAMFRAALPGEAPRAAAVMTAFAR